MLSKLFGTVTIADQEKPITKRSPWTVINKAASTTTTRSKINKKPGLVTSVQSAPPKQPTSKSSAWSSGNVYIAKSADEVIGQRQKYNTSTSSISTNLSEGGDLLESKDSRCSVWLSKQECHTPSKSDSKSAHSRSVCMLYGLLYNHNIERGGYTRDKNKMVTLFCILIISTCLNLVRHCIP